MTFDIAGKRIWVAGHRGMVGAAVVRRLAGENCEVITAGRDTVDLKRQAEVEAFMADAKPDAVVMAAAKVGGILANDTYPADFLYDNLAIQNAVIHAAWQNKVSKLAFLGSSCIYPKEAPQPISEDSLLTGPLEPTNEAYALAKITGLTLCRMLRRQYGFNAICLMPTNLYGPGDNFDLANSHVLPALIRKAHEAKLRGDRTLPVWGSGRPRREFLHVDDLADAVLHCMDHYEEEGPINIGTGQDVAIADLARMVCQIVGFTGDITLDPSKPDGTMRKLLDISRLNALGWHHKIAIKDGIASTYEWYRTQTTATAP